MKKSTRSSARSDGSSQAAVPGLIVCLVAMGIAALGFLLPYQRSESFLSLSVGNSSSLYLAGSLLITLAAPLAILVASIVALTSANARIKCTPIALGTCA